MVQKQLSDLDSIPPTDATLDELREERSKLDRISGVLFDTMSKLKWKQKKFSEAEDFGKRSVDLLQGEMGDQVF